MLITSVHLGFFYCDTYLTIQSMCLSNLKKSALKYQHIPQEVFYHKASINSVHGIL